MCPYCKGMMQREKDRLSGEGMFDDDAYGLDRHYQCTCHTDKKVPEVKRILEWVQSKSLDLIKEEGTLEDLMDWLGDLSQEDIEGMIKEGPYYD